MHVICAARAAWLALLLGVGAAFLAVPAAHAVEPGMKHAQTPASLGLQAENVAFPAADSVMVPGWWFQGPRDAPVIVVASRGSGTMADMLPAVQQFLARGFHVLTFDYRGFGPGTTPAAGDSLRHIVFNSQWVDEMVGALRYARARGGGHVFAWGQDLGSAVTLAGAVRDHQGCDAAAVEGLFRTAQEALLANGTSVINEVVVRHRRLVQGPDDPFCAASRLAMPIFVVLAGKDEVTPPAITKQVIGQVLGPARTWEIPTAGHAGAEKTPGYFDRLAQWFRQWMVFPPGGRTD